MPDDNFPQFIRAGVRLIIKDQGQTITKNCTCFVKANPVLLEIARSAQSFLVGVSIPTSGTEAQREVGKKLYAKYCSQCHGDAHKDATDAAKATLPTPETCKGCHKKQYDQYMGGKHSKGWVAMAAMPTNSLQPHPYISGLKGCGGCHRVGIKLLADPKTNKTTRVRVFKSSGAEIKA